MPFQRILLPVWPYREPSFFTEALRAAEFFIQGSGELFLLCVIRPSAPLFGQRRADPDASAYLRKVGGMAKFANVRDRVSVTGRVDMGLMDEAVKRHLSGADILVLSRDSENAPVQSILSLKIPVYVCGSDPSGETSGKISHG